MDTLTQTHIDKIMAFRTRFHELLNTVRHHGMKSGEGEIDLLFPAVYDEPESTTVGIMIRSYLLCPRGRTETIKGTTWDIVCRQLDEFQKSIEAGARLWNR